MKSSSKISLRKAVFLDIEFLWYLRNQPDVYKYSRQNRTVGWKEHIDWITPVILGLSNKELFVIKKSKFPIGQIRFDYDGRNGAEVSISILKEFLRKGFATKALNLAIKQVKKQNKTRLLIAVTHKKNIASQKLFEKLNFKLKIKKGKWLEYTLRI